MSAVSPLVGQLAPDFSLPTDVAPLTLSSLRGRAVVLYFYPKDNTPTCTTQACDFRDNLEAITAAGLTVVGVSPDGPKSHAKFRATYGLTFPLVADEEQVAARAYGVWRTKKQYGREYQGVVRSTFLIDQAGVIRQVWDGVRVRRSKGGKTILHVDEVLQAVAAL